MISLLDICPLRFRMRLYPSSMGAICRFLENFLIPNWHITYILRSNLTHFTAQSHPYYTLKWLRLARNIAEIKNEEKAC